MLTSRGRDAAVDLVEHASGRPRVVETHGELGPVGLGLDPVARRRSGVPECLLAPQRSVEDLRGLPDVAARVRLDHRVRDGSQQAGLTRQGRAELGRVDAAGGTSATGPVASPAASPPPRAAHRAPSRLPRHPCRRPDHRLPAARRGSSCPRGPPG
ncbi:hypothetical protein NKG05_26370 [Oerskovia sp. M15]